MDKTLEKLIDLAVRHGEVVIRATPNVKHPWEVESEGVYGYGRNLIDATSMAAETDPDE